MHAKQTSLFAANTCKADNGGAKRMVDSRTTYDRENRITLTQGELVDIKNAQGVVTGQQILIAASQAGNRHTTCTASCGRRRSNGRGAASSQHLHDVVKIISPGLDAGLLRQGLRRFADARVL